MLFTSVFAQEREVIALRASSASTPCTPTSNLNISTGLDASGGLISPGTTDPFWGGKAIAPLTGAYSPWNLIAGTMILNSSGAAGGLESAGNKIFKRCFYLCKETKVSFKGVYRDDNMVQSLELKNSGGTVVWSQTSLPTNDPQCYKDNAFSGSVGLPAGQYCLEFTYNNSSSIGGFALSCMLSTSEAVLANYANCCCDCSQIPQKPQINGASCFCWSKDCNTTFTYSVPDYGTKNCVSYSWNVTNANGTNVNNTGQGTNQISFNCKDIQPGIYNVTIHIKCGNKEFTNTLMLTVCQKPNPSFTMNSDGSSATFISAGGGTDYWFLVKDDNGDCAYNSPETYQYLGGSTPTFTGLATGQQYTVYHFVYNSCGNNCGCWSSKVMCFKWLPSSMKTMNGAKGVEAVSEKMIEKHDEIPNAFWKELPKEMKNIRKSDIIKD